MTAFPVADEFERQVRNKVPAVRIELTSVGLRGITQGLEESDSLAFEFLMEGMVVDVLDELIPGLQFCFAAAVFPQAGLLELVLFHFEFR